MIKGLEQLMINILVIATHTRIRIYRENVCVACPWKFLGITIH